MKIREPHHTHPEARALAHNLIDHDWHYINQTDDGKSHWQWPYTQEHFSIDDNNPTPGHYQALAITARLIQMKAGVPA